MNEVISYGRQWIDEDDIQAVVEVLKGDFLTQGPKIEEFEKNICDYVGSKYCVAVSNGTAALHLAVASLEIEPGKKGITSPITFMASPNAMVYNDIRPDFVDIDAETYCLDHLKVEEKIDRDTRLIIPVHFAGQPCDMGSLYEIAQDNKLFIVEDAAHAIGSKYSDGTPVGKCKYSDLSTFSFHPVKTITTGEGGAITTNNKDLYEKLLLLRSHGITKDNSKFQIENLKVLGPWYHEMQLLGYNYRLTDIQAGLGISQLKKLDRFVQRRREIVRKYNDEFKSIDWLKIPFEKPDVYSAFHLYVLQIDFSKIGKSRKKVMEELQNKKIGTQVHYIPVHTQPYYRMNFGTNWSDFPIAENYYQKALSIPLYPRMTDEDVNYVIQSIKGLYE